MVLIFGRFPMKHRFEMMFKEALELDMAEVYDAYETGCYEEFKAYPTDGNWTIFQSACELVKRFEEKN
jgi:hypothetical protein